MSAYVIYHYKILDPSRIGELREPSVLLNEKYGGKFVVASPVKALEGETLTHMVIKEFESFKAAQEYYYSDEHKELSELRKKITEGWTTIIPGHSETQAVVNSGYFDAKL